jgi:DNA-binding SARP family transcriptional activator
MEFRLLGDVEVVADGRLVDIGHARQQWVLVALLLDANRAVSVDDLGDRIWDGRPPQSWRETIYGYVSRLRSALTGLDVEIARRPGGYILTTDPDTIDLNRFRRLVREARWCPDDYALVVYERALGLWRGEPLGGFDNAWLASLRPALHAEHLAARLDRNAIAVHRRPEQAVVELIRLAAAHPFHEHVTALLMIALQRSGRTAEALAAGRQLRQRLDEELGIDVGPEVRNVELAILRGDYVTDGVARRAEPAQPSPAQPSPAQPSPAQPSPAQPSPAQPSPAQPSPAQRNPAQPAPARSSADRPVFSAPPAPAPVRADRSATIAAIDQLIARCVDRPQRPGQYRYFEVRYLPFGADSNRGTEMWIPLDPFDDWLVRRFDGDNHEELRGPYGGGHFPVAGSWHTPTPDFYASVPRDPQTMYRTLRAMFPEPGWSADAPFVEIRNALTSFPAPADLRVTVLRLLRDDPAILATSNAPSFHRTRATAIGVAHLNGPRQERTDILFDSATAEVLGANNDGRPLNANRHAIVDNLGQRP